MAARPLAEHPERAQISPRRWRDFLIVNHQGRGWWDPQTAAKGDIFDLMQYLDPRLNFGEVRRELRRLVGVAPCYPGARRPRD